MLKWRAEIKDYRNPNKEDKYNFGDYEISVVLVDTESRFKPHHADSWGWEDFNNKIIFPHPYGQVSDEQWNKMVDTAHAFADLLNKRDGYGQTTDHSNSESSM